MAIKQPIFFLLILPFACMAQGDCPDLLYAKADQYYTNVKKKPDSMKYITCRYIREKLQKDEVFIDIMETTMNGIPIFLTTIINKFDSVETIEIPKADRSTKKNEDDITLTNINRSSVSLSDNLKSQTAFYSAYNNFFKYLEPYITNSKTIYYSSSGILNLINLKHVKTKDNEPLFKKYKLIRLHTAASFIQNHHRLMMPKQMSLLLVGNLQYDCPDEKTTNRAWCYLPGTAKEINSIHSSVSKNHRCLLLDSCKATEASVIATINKSNYDIIHFATHGFHFKNPDSVFGVSNQTYPLMLTGIVLSGGNSSHATLRPFNGYGLFTTYDFLDLDISRIKLVVLSTCHSGEGPSTQSSAPLGLTLALLRQGINAMIVSNQAVPDNEATIFMQTLYKYMNVNVDVDECFNKTLNELAKLYPTINWNFFDLVH